MGQTRCLPAPSGLLIYDIANPTNPVLVGSWYTGSDSPKHVEVSGSYAYLGVGTLNGMLVVVDVSNPASPEFVSDLGSLPQPGRDGLGLDVLRATNAPR